nr:ABC transporter ATP-binding protein [Saccharomonospora cyanea]
MADETAAALEAVGLGKRYRRGWGLRDCTFSLPRGSVCALVGPNGAGKSTLLSLTTGLRRPTTGEMRVLGQPADGRGTHPGLSFLAQDKPLFSNFTVEEMLRAGRSLNTDWDAAYARRLVTDADVPTRARIGTLSGGQRTRVALAVALGRRPTVLVLDEPLADLDPVARADVMQVLMAEVAETGMTVLLSSHVLSDLENVCDHLLLLSGGELRLAGDVDRLVSEHALLIGPAGDHGYSMPEHAVVEARSTARQVTFLLRDTPQRSVPGPGWEVHDPTLEELVMAYLRATKPLGTTQDEEVAA